MKSKYKKEYAKKLLAHMKEGLTFEAFGALVGVDRSTLHRWRERHPEFREAFEKGFNHGLIFWEKMGRSGAAGKLKGFNVACWIFIMKNRFGWRDKQDIKHEGGVNVSINIDKDDAEL